MRRRLLLRIPFLVLLAELLVPTAAYARTGPDPLRTLGADSPLCKQSVDSVAHANCRATGALEHAYPLDHYRFDWHIKTGVTHITENVLAVIQWLTSIVWMASLYLLKGVLLMFQWAFSLDLLGKSMAAAKQAMLQLHTGLLGEPWFLAAISVLGLWALWRGLVQHKKIETIAGLATAVVMMVLALGFISRPDVTVGELSRASNSMSLAFLSGASNGTLARPQMAVSKSSEQLFNTIVLRPWCALNFGDVNWCLSRAPGDRLTHAERYLRYAPDSKQRSTEYTAIHEAPWTPNPATNADAFKQVLGYRVAKADVSKSDMQGKSKTVTRVVLFVLILIGQVGCIALVGWLAFKVLLAGLMTLVLLMAAPVMLFAPAFGEAGRGGFRKWALKLLAAVVSKAIYALFLAIVLAVAALIAKLDTVIPWAAVWLLNVVYWWGILLKRNQLLEWASFGGKSSAGGASELYHKAKLAGMASGAVGGFVGARFGKAGGRVGAASDGVRARSHAHRQAVRDLSDEKLRERATEQLDHKYADNHDRVAAHDDAREKIARLNKGPLADYDRRRARAERNGEAPPQLSDKEQRALAQRKALEQKLMPAAEYGVARKFIETADKNQVEQGRRFSDKQIDLAAEGLRADLKSGRGAEDPVHAWRAGMPQSQLDKLSPEERQSLNRRIGEDLERDRKLLGGAPGDEALPRGRARRAAQSVVGHRHVRERRSEHLRQRKETREADALVRRQTARLHRRPRR
jgi:hypothetical protein